MRWDRSLWKHPSLMVVLVSILLWSVLNSRSTKLKNEFKELLPEYCATRIINTYEQENRIQAVGLLIALSALAIVSHFWHQRKQHHLSISKLNQRLKLISTSTSSMAVLTNTHGEIEWVNDSFLKITGFNLEEVIGVKPGSLLSGPETSAAGIEKIRNALYRKEPIEITLLNYTKSKKKYWNKLEIKPIYNENNIHDGYISLQSDITEQVVARQKLEESELRFRSLADAAPVLIWMSGTDKKCHYFNKTWLEFTGRTLEQEQGDGWAEGVHPEDFGSCLKIYCTSFDARIPFRMEYRIRRADGSYRTLLDTGIPRFSSSGEFLGYIGSCIDIQDYKETEKLLQESKDVLKKNTEFKTEILQVMSHQIRSPMNGVIGFSQLLQQSTLDSDQKDYVSSIVESGNKLLKTIDQIMEFWKFETGKIEFEKHTVNTQQWLMDLAQPFQNRARSKNIELKTNFHSSLPPNFLCDSQEIKKSLSKLLDNAIQYTDQGTVTLSVEASPLPSAALESRRSLLQFKIEDQGKGIKPEKLLELLYPVNESILSPESGQSQNTESLGLAIARKSVELMGGTLRAQSKINQGTLFILEVPVTIPEAIQEQPPSLDLLKPQNQQMQVLVIDDHPINRKLASHLLKSMNCPHECVESAKNGLALLSTKSFELILMDIQMPEMDGYQATQKIREMESLKLFKKRHKIVALTANAMTGDREKCMKVGMDGYLTKPLDYNELFATIQR